MKDERISCLRKFLMFHLLSLYLVWVKGFEPSASRFQGEHSTQAELHPDINTLMFRTLIILLLCGCATVNTPSSKNPRPVDTAIALDGLGEQNHRAEIKQLIGVDPSRYEWCAAFVNSILELHSIPGSESVSNNPLLARSFLEWGIPTDQPKYGDIVIFKRGKAGWQGHVGFYIDTVNVDGVKKILVVGGNQNNKVGFDYYDASRLLGYRKIP